MKSLALVDTDSEETNRENQPANRESDGKFASGNKLGVGGPRPGSGRPPKPKDPTLLKQLYDILDESAPRALERLTEFIESSDEKISLKACAEILRKVLPESKLLTSWSQGAEEAGEELEVFKDFLAFKRGQDIAELEKKESDEPEHPSEAGQEFDEKEKPATVK